MSARSAKLVTVTEELLNTLSFLYLNHAFNLIFSSNEKSILKSRYVQQNTPEGSLDSHDPQKVISNFS